VLWVELVYAFWMQRPQVIHFQWLSDPQKDYYLIQFLKFLGFKVVYTAHNLLPHGSVPGHKKVFQRIYQLVDKVVVHATRNKEEMVDEFAIDPNKIAVIPHGAYRLFYRDSSTTKERARQELGIPDHKRVILFFGSIRRYKGLEYLVRAFQMVREKLENVMLLIVGEVPPADAEEVEYYSKFLAAVENEEDVVPRRGYIDFDKVGDYFTASDVVVLPYLKTYQSGVLLLAYAAGKPVVVTDTGGLAEVVEEGKSGFVVSPMNAEHLAQAIISVIADPSRAEEMGRYAKHLSVEKYSWDEVARKTLEVYRSVIHD
jgi:glycosyltransferase involved in cell wall biosynthesis